MAKYAPRLPVKQYKALQFLLLFALMTTAFWRNKQTIGLQLDDLNIEC